MLTEKLFHQVEFLYDKSFQMLDLDQYTLLKIFAVGTPDVLGLEREADLVEWLVKVLVSIPDKLKTVLLTSIPFM